MPRLSRTLHEATHRLHYWEFSPSKDLPGLDGTWSLELAPEIGSLVHQPPGCPAVQVIFDLIDRTLWVKGAHLRPEPTRLKAGSRYCGIRLRASAATWLVGDAAVELRNRVQPWRDVTRDPWWRTLAESLEETSTVEPALGVIVAHLRRRPPPRIDRVAERARQLIACQSRYGRGDSSRMVEHVAKAVELSPRQLRRRFSNAMGLSPKDYHQALRVRVCGRRMIDEPTASVACIAHAAGFADQAHLSRQFRAHIGLSPRQYRSRYLVPSTSQRAVVDALMAP